MFKLNPKFYYLRHEFEIQRFVSTKSEWVHLINNQNSFASFTSYPEKLFKLDLNEDIAAQLTLLKKNKYDLIVITDIFELTDDIFKFLESLNELLTNNGKILINSINTKWNFILLLSEMFKFKKISRPRSYIHLKKINSISEAAGFRILKSYTRQIFPFKLLNLGSFTNCLLEVIFYKLNLGINNYLLLTKNIINKQSYTKTIIVPAKNEEKNIEPLILRIPKFNAEYEIIIVCGNSNDDTLKVANRVKDKNPSLPIKVIKQHSNGKGPGVMEALSIAKYDLITILDSDLSIDPETLIHFFNIVEEGRADFINGTRFIYKMQTGAMRKLNNLGNLFFQSIISIVISQKLTDSLCGTKVFKKDLVEKIIIWKKTLNIKDPFGDFDLIFSAGYYGNKILEYPVHYKARVYGTTQISRFSDGLKLLLYFINSLITFNSSKTFIKYK